MAIAMLSVKVGKAGKAAPHAEYIMREGRYADLAEARARGPESRQLERLEATGSGNMPAWAQHAPVLFWQASDRYERAGGSTYREMEIALPRELTPAQRADLVRTWVDQELGGKHAYQWAIHVPKALDGGEQPHVHLMFSERQVDDVARGPEQYFKRWNSKNPERGGCRKGFLAVDPTLKGAECAAARAAELKALRERWGVVCNQALEQAGRAERIDLRSHAERGTGLVPEPKAGPKAWRNPARRAEIIEFRAARAERAAALAEVERLIPDMGAEIIQLEVAAKKRADRLRWEAMTQAELSQEEVRSRPLRIELLAERRPGAVALKAQLDDAEQRKQAAGEAIDQTTLEREAWCSKHWFQAHVLHGLKPRPQLVALENELERQKALKEAAESDRQRIEAEVQASKAGWHQEAVDEHQNMADRHARLLLVLQAKKDQAAREAAEQKAREEAERALQAEAKKVLGQLQAAVELRSRGRLSPEPLLAQWLDWVDQLPASQRQEAMALALTSNPQAPAAVAKLLQPHQVEMAEEIQRKEPRHRTGLSPGR